MKFRFSIVLSLFLLSYELSAQEVTTDYDKSADFTKYMKYTFGGWTKDSDKSINQLDQERIIAAFKDEFAQRNLVADDDNPDMEVTLYAVVKDKTNTTAYTNYYGGMGYGRSFGYGYGSTSYSQQEYQEGTIIVDFYDAQSKDLLWQGVIKAEVKQNAKKKDKSVAENVRRLMYKYPIKPGKQKKKKKK